MLVGFVFWYRGLALGGIAGVGQLQLLQPFFGLALAGLLLRRTGRLDDDRGDWAGRSLRRRRQAFRLSDEVMWWTAQRQLSSVGDGLLANLRA